MNVVISKCVARHNSATVDIIQETAELCRLAKRRQVKGGTECSDQRRNTLNRLGNVTKSVTLFSHPCALCAGLVVFSANARHARGDDVLEICERVLGLEQEYAGSLEISRPAADEGKS